MPDVNKSLSDPRLCVFIMVAGNITRGRGYHLADRWSEVNRPLPPSTDNKGRPATLIGHLENKPVSCLAAEVAVVCFYTDMFWPAN